MGATDSEHKFRDAVGPNRCPQDADRAVASQPSKRLRWNRRRIVPGVRVTGVVEQTGLGGQSWRRPARPAPSPPSPVASVALRRVRASFLDIARFARPSSLVVASPPPVQVRHPCQAREPRHFKSDPGRGGLAPFAAATSFSRARGAWAGAQSVQTRSVCDHSPLAPSPPVP
jgi:hypothetical protein